MSSWLMLGRSTGLPDRMTPATVLVRSSRRIGRDDIIASMSREC